MESKKQKMKRLRSLFNEECKKRDKNRCAVCGKESPLSVHHISPRHNMPQDGYSKSNGITLCDGENSCHWKAEDFINNGSNEYNSGYEIDSLYRKINSSKNQAIKESEELK
jgi:hypothetical protein